MNLFHLNTGVDNKVLLNADYDIRRYTDFINKSIELLKRETLSIKVTKTVVEGETRYIPEIPSNKKSEKAIELLFNENTKSIFDQKRNFNREVTIEIEDQNEDENYITLETDIQGDTIYLKPDTYQLEQQKRALDNLRHRPLKEHQPLLELFGFPENRFWQQSFYEKELPWTILTDETKDGVEEQREFVFKGLQTKDFALMEGPPGSGKTTTIIELIMQYTAEGKRVLLCSATHAAIDNVIERIKGRYKEICDKEIVPVRISRFEKPVKENVRPYLLRNLVATYKADIEKHLKKNQKLESQKFLLTNLYKKEEKEIDPIEKIILDSANLVAGTMIGILQHPDIRANKQGASFDVLIVDEASKVTFSDFIVPALHAKKWILVGDVKQLSPYVENDYVSENIATMLDAEIQKSIVKQFELKSKLDDKKFEDCLKVFFTDQNPNTEKQFVESRELVVETVEENWEVNEINIAKINSADVVIAKNESRVKQLLSNNIQVKSIFINGETSSLQQRYRQEYARQSYKNPLPYLFDSRQEEWSEMVSSRLNQSFSFRNAGTEFENIDRELNYLIPNKILDDINQIKRLVFPSILELLQNGIGKGSGQASNRVLSDGFHPHYKTSRFVSLTYQHRMHPDIAKTSKENFYENNLKSANTVLENRGWKYALNEPIVKWIYNNDSTGNKRGEKIINPTEANDIERELVKFLDWAKDNPKPNGEKYEVAVLTFYLNQETELRRRIRRITKQGFFSKFHKHNADIYLYTVDKFQGQEADLVLLGFTKNTRDAHFNSPNRLNVALTRARHKLILFGNRPWFKERAKLKALRDLATNFESTIRY
ncbi:MAG: AAA family ATPase [Flavobacteriales bacterium]|nr:AAA family ATPase [Flavobacteriales bacterium]